MKRLMTLRAILGAVGLVMSGAVVVASASALSLPLSLNAATASPQKATAGQPVSTSVLLCGTWTQGMDRISGQSSIDHPSGSSAMGSEYPYASQNCENPGNSNGTFAWTVSHSNVNTSTERGTEHGLAMLSTDMNKNAGFNGQITNYDFSTPLTAAGADPCNGRWIYYASGQTDTSGSCSPAGPGNFNTHGGAATGDHFHGKYGTVVYQDDNNMSCRYNGGNNPNGPFCFEAILQGQTN